MARIKSKKSTGYIFVLITVFITSSYAGQSCLSCSNVESFHDCFQHVTCANDEVCYQHTYKTETGSYYYDFGCSYPEFCGHSINGIFGKRSEGQGHHIVCVACCNSTQLCNQGLTCTHTSNTNGHKFPRECSDIANSTNGVYDIHPDGTTSVVAAFCDMTTENHKWTVIQRRYNGSVDFYRNWESYKEGFGYPNGEYWIGNDVIHELTAHENHELKIEMSDFEGETRFAKYTSFSVGDEASGYRLHVSGYSGDAGDSLAIHSGLKFSTHEMPTGSCAKSYHGGWWYGQCHQSNLNGKYLAGHTTSYADGVVWLSWRGYYYSLKTVTMKIRKHNVK